MLAQEVGFGLILDDEAYNSVPLAPVLSRGDYKEIPIRASLKPYTPIPGDQGKTSTCVGWATAYAARTIVAALENGWDVEGRDWITDQAFSPSYIYNRLKARYTKSGPDTYCTKGSFIPHALDLLKSEGVADIGSFPFDCQLEVTEGDIEDASDNRIIEYQRLFATDGQDKIKNVRKSLASRKPVVVGMHITTSFLNAYNKEVWIPSEVGEEAEGAHALTVIGYDDERYGGAFEVMNSWGMRWGTEGFIWIPYEHFSDYVRYGFDVFVPEVQKANYPDLTGKLYLQLESGKRLGIEERDGIFYVTQALASLTKFRIYLETGEPSYVYSMGSDLTRKVTRLVPIDESRSALINYAGSTIRIPEPVPIQLDETPGTDELAVLISKHKIDLESLIDDLSLGPGTLSERLSEALSDKLYRRSAFTLADNGEISYAASTTSMSVLSIVVQIEHQALAPANDIAPPILTLLYPRPPESTARGLRIQRETNKRITIVGTAVDDSKVESVSVNGIEAVFDQDGVTFRAVLPVAEDGIASVLISATDTHGNSAEAEFRLEPEHIDSEAPIVALTEPKTTRLEPTGVSVIEDSLLVRGTFSDNSELRGIFVNGMRANTSRDGSFWAYVPIFDGSTELTVHAVDIAGNESIESFFVSDSSFLGTGEHSDEEDFSLFDVYYGTNRNRTGRESPNSFYGGERGAVDYGIVQVSIPLTHRLGEVEAPSFWRLQFKENPSKHVMLYDLIPLSKESMFGSMQSAVGDSKEKTVLVFVHGYNVTFRDAARRTAQLAYDLSLDGVPAFFSWPSEGTMTGYLKDETDAQWAVHDLTQFVDDIYQMSGATTVHLVAHSMGTRALSQALQPLAERESEPIFENVLLAAPDIDADIFRRDQAPALRKVARRVTLYASSNDKALKASKKFKGAPRAGDAGENLVVVPGIDTIDASGIDIGLLGLGHSYFSEKKVVLWDVYRLIQLRLTPVQRELKQGTNNQLPYWMLGVN